MYTIGMVAEMFSLSVPTLRYYDKEGLLPEIKRSKGGVRQFDTNDVECLKLVECLKKTGMSLKDIRTFLAWCKQGDKSLKERKSMFLERKKEVKRQIAELESTLEMIDFKCWYYETAEKAGTEKAVHSIPKEDLPPVAKKYLGKKAKKP